LGPNFGIMGIPSDLFYSNKDRVYDNYDEDEDDDHADEVEDNDTE